MKKQFEVLYTRQKTQKTKTWHDGVVEIDNVKGNNRISLYKIDENGYKGNIVESFSSHAQKINVSKISFPGHLIQLVNEESVEEVEPEVDEDANTSSVSKSISNKTPKSSENYENKNSFIKKNLARPFKTPLVKVNMDICRSIQSKAPKKISKNIPLSKISSKQGFIKALERIYILDN
ncbi:ABC-transporter [Cryptosporidium sp. chipmunk genotype I]|uniref:ABC-transporter n=1 Tax=Cryptosporidium sp. chipmunk genotype I TaxID=1280935 RepID=UPI00351A2709|nr:ABC-transporter [Cryptosporidium sp. chipmunk genotype I]